tara:strand:- start:258 stop:413 length:156 start_codon:yes stop_codon:yes gene_type:complete
MISQEAEIVYGNGDRFVGGVDNNKKQGNDCTYYYRNGDMYKGPFLRDVKET